MCESDLTEESPESELAVKSCSPRNSMNSVPGGVQGPGSVSPSPGVTNWACTQLTLIDASRWLHDLKSVSRMNSRKTSELFFRVSGLEPGMRGASFSRNCLRKRRN